jgi:2-haloacid dehalogenase
VFTRPAAVVFETLGTLFSLEPLRTELVRLSLPAAALEEWQQRMVHLAEELSERGEVEPFGRLARRALRQIADHHDVDVPDAALRGALESLGRLAPHRDARAALETLRQAGVRLAVLTIGDTASTRALLERAGLAELVEQVLGSDAVGAFHPDAEAYLAAAQRLEVEAQELALVSAHPWEVEGARQAGLVAAWCNRRGESMPAGAGAPPVTGADLSAVARQLLTGELTHWVAPVVPVQ